MNPPLPPPPYNEKLYVERVAEKLLYASAGNSSIRFKDEDIAINCRAVFKIAQEFVKQANERREQ